MFGSDETVAKKNVNVTAEVTFANTLSLNLTNDTIVTYVLASIREGVERALHHDFGNTTTGFVRSDVSVELSGRSSNGHGHNGEGESPRAHNSV